ncbi:PilZ domain-containing protein [Sphingomicrobium clamense]|uniref:PilZ domain-containing protein n=1 Tax=Sphingomicrobium clamense TaxID=2851013 RepID=A0ABS6V6Z2_9SPHN|nr:PilZ domain-containing protein [Sphingomicrobium sp. B8]MBW0145341.1 PilZ domain-containing protein [Sphingomicrobium sp. B8]
MLGALIKRKKRPFGQDNLAFESTVFTLSTEVPRPVERRIDERVMPTLRVAKLLQEGDNEQLIRVRNLSAGGLMAEIGQQVEVGETCSIELNSQMIPSSVVWIREGTAGFKFDQNIDLGEMLAGRKPRHGFRPRPPRLQVACKANLRIGRTYYTVDVHDVSLGGLKVEPIDEYCLGKPVTVVVESLRPLKGEVRWYSNRKAGIVFDKPLKFEELSEWMGKRLEVATLKAAVKDPRPGRH